jgi:hypothetical protein
MKLLTVLTLSLLLSSPLFAQEKEPCESVILKFRNFSFRSYQIIVPGESSIAAAFLGTTTFHVTPGQEMQFEHNGQHYLLLNAGMDHETVERYNLNRMIKKRKRELNI